MGADFKPLYQEILKNTGVMTAEDVVMKNLKMDIEKEDFWNTSIDMVKKSIDHYASLIQFFKTKVIP